MLLFYAHALLPYHREQWMVPIIGCDALHADGSLLIDFLIV